METSRDDVGIAIRSAFLSRGTQQKFSLVLLIAICVILLFFETIETKPLNYVRSFLKDAIYRGSVVVGYPSKFFSNTIKITQEHFSLYENYNKLKNENIQLKGRISSSDFLTLENTQLKELINDQITSEHTMVSARIMLDKQSPYLNSFIINIGSNKGIKNGMAVLDKNNFVGRIVDVNFFSSRVLLVSDLNSKIPVVIEPSASHAIMSGNGSNNPSLLYLPENHTVQDENKVYTSGKEGIFTPGIPIGKTQIKDGKVDVSLFSNLNQITFVNINLGKLKQID